VRVTVTAVLVAIAGAAVVAEAAVNDVADIDEVLVAGGLVAIAVGGAACLTPSHPIFLLFLGYTKVCFGLVRLTLTASHLQPLANLCDYSLLRKF
jgi:hypothetical protein